MVYTKSQTIFRKKRPLVEDARRIIKYSDLAPLHPHDLTVLRDHKKIERCSSSQAYVKRHEKRVLKVVKLFLLTGVPLNTRVASKVTMVSRLRYYHAKAFFDKIDQNHLRTVYMWQNASAEIADDDIPRDAMFMARELVTTYKY